MSGQRHHLLVRTTVRATVITIITIILTTATIFLTIITIAIIIVIIITVIISSVQFSRSVVSDSLQPHGLQHAGPPCPSPTPRTCSNSCPWSQ